MNDDEDVYNYDKSIFFRLLEDRQYADKYERVQEQQGLVVCPLQIKHMPSNENDLIDKHLFVPSLYFKNQYVPICFASKTSNTPQVYMSIVSDGDQPLVEFSLFNSAHRKICPDVKLLKCELAYSASQRPYRILIVDRDFYFTTPSEKDRSAGEQANRTKSIASRTSSVSSVVGPSLAEVNTFANAIDFLHSTRIIAPGSDENICEMYLKEVDLFRKTYFVLHSHLQDCLKRLTALYVKGLKSMFTYLEPADSFVELKLAIAWEIVVTGCLYSKLWPAIMTANQLDDQRVVNKINLVRMRINLDEEDEQLSDGVIESCVKLFKLERVYFQLNVKPIMKELKKLELLNNPYERLECIKGSVNLLINQLTMSSLGKRQLIVTGEVLVPLLAFVLVRCGLSHYKSSVYFVDTFSLSKTNDMPAVNPLVTGNGHLAELEYFWTTFKASLQLIENF